MSITAQEVADVKILIGGEHQPSLSTIIWRYYFNVYKDGTKAGQMAEAYMAQLTAEQEKPN